MPNKEYIHPLGLGAVSGLVISAGPVSFLTLILSYFAPLPLFAAALIWGTMGGALSSLAGVLVAGLVGGVWSALVFAGLFAFPIYLLTKLALLARDDLPGSEGKVIWYPVGTLLAWLCSIAAIYFLIAVAATAGQDGGLFGVLASAMAEVYGDFSTMAGGGNIGVDPQALSKAQAPYIPAILALSWILMIAINGGTAQRLAERMKRNLRPRTPIADMELPQWLMWAFGVSLGLSVLGGGFGNVGGTLAAIFAAPYLFLGIAIVHKISRGIPNRNLLLLAFYVLILFLPWLGIGLAVMGFFEQWIGLRRKFSGKGSNQE